MSADLIDVHAHFLTPEYVAAAQRAGHLVPDGMPAWPTWSAAEHLEVMDRNGISKSILSVSSPGVHFGDDVRARVLARRMNEAAAELTREYAGRFGFFASLPLPDLDGALAEVGHAFDALDTNGVVLPSNVGGRYPGDPRWQPLWQELNEREAVVFIHPTSPPNWRDVALDRPRPMIEFLFDGARAVSDLVLSGVLTHYPRVRFVITYAGGVLPMLSDRLATFQSHFAVGADDDLPSAADQLREFWYDVAGTAIPHHLPGLQAVAGLDRVVYGSEYCFTPPESVATKLAQLDAAPEAKGWRDLTTVNGTALLT
ncbi:amidohydrolase [Kribbella sp. NBC_01245]|uniref:amidohydrolase family protein n=1 Tax=Kribbella sp. NBC_01245 TaxID=2903578 RepID=UPI002E2C6911|nr:amidohydrolase family protein [Kribbella sp. NBC_01245]